MKCRAIRKAACMARTATPVVMGRRHRSDGIFMTAE
jgi:hypothetical protein